jgi:ATP-dependent helicase HrpB
VTADEPVVLTAPTGSGKSTRVPGMMERALGGRVLVLEPRRVACRALASYLARSRGGLGREVGYRVRFEDRSSADTRILFVTPGIALRMLRDDRLGWAGVLVDEFHERSWQVDLAVTLLRARLSRQERFSLVVASATLQARALAEQMGGRVLETHGRTFPVDVEHLPEPGAPSGRDLEQRVADEVARALARDPGDVLVFLPGKGEIERARRELLSRDALGDARLVAVHGGVPPRELSAAFERDERSRRVYLATNVAETSLTVPGVRTVIDSGLVRQRVHRAGRSVLALVAASRASLDQRAGRAGRTAPGRCVRLFSAAHRPQEQTPPELARVELDDLVLDAAAAGINANDLERAPWPTPPPAFALARARDRLRAAGAIDGAGALTDLGRRVAALPLSASDAAILIDPPAGLERDVADLAALLDLERDPLLPLAALPPRARDDVAEARAELLGDAAHEVDALLRCLRRGDPRRHGLHSAALDAARRRAEAFRGLLDVRPASATKDDALTRGWDAIAAHLLRRVPEAGFVLRPRALRPPAKRARRGRERDEEPWANGEVEVEVTPWRPPIPDPPELARARAGVLLQHTWLEGGRRQATRGRGWMLLPCAPAALAHAGLGEVRATDPTITGKAGVTVRARVQRVLSEVVLSEEDEVLAGAPLREALASFFLDDRWRRGAREAVLEDLHLWRLAHAWPRTDPDLPLGEANVLEPEADERAYVVDRLATLGVEAGADCALLDDDDLRPDLEAVTGLPAWELDRLRTDFPRLWRHAGGTFRCDVEPTRRRVTLEPLDKAARKLKTPAAAVVPRFRGFAVRHRQASRVVDLR